MAGPVTRLSILYKHTHAYKPLHIHSSLIEGSRKRGVGKKFWLEREKNAAIANVYYFAAYALSWFKLT